MFATRTGRPLARNNVWTSLRRTAQRAVKETLGHASLATTSIYVHARNGGDSGLWLD